MSQHQEDIPCNYVKCKRNEMAKCHFLFGLHFQFTSELRFCEGLVIDCIAALSSYHDDDSNHRQNSNKCLQL